MQLGYRIMCHAFVSKIGYVSFCRRLSVQITICLFLGLSCFHFLFAATHLGLYSLYRMMFFEETKKRKEWSYFGNVYSITQVTVSCTDLTNLVYWKHGCGTFLPMLISSVSKQQNEIRYFLSRQQLVYKSMAFSYSQSSERWKFLCCQGLRRLILAQPKPNTGPQEAS